MSVTAKLPQAILLSTIFAATTVSAQEMDSNFFSGMTTSPPEAESTQLINTLDKMITDVGDMDLSSASNETVTIEEIDKRNRQAQRLRNDIALRELHFQEMRAKIDMLVALDTAKRELLAKDKPEQNSEAQEEFLPPEQLAKKEEFDEAKAAQERQQEMAYHEQMSIPRVVEIRGGAGELTAVIESVTGVRQEVKVGGILVNGFRVKDITIDGVTITGDVTGQNYFMPPSNETVSQPESDGLRDAIDMGMSMGGGMGIF